MIEVKNAVKTFDGFAALDGASITVPDGGVYGLVGPNGAGKSTIIRHLTGIYRPDSGAVLVDGAPVYENPEKKALIAAIPDDWYYFQSATIRDMMRFYKGFYPNFDMARYERFKEVFTLPEKSPIRRMSKGMQKQAAFWLTMCCRPKYLILDEPVDGLDPVMRRQVWSLMMGDVTEHGTTVLVSSHNLRELEDVCDHVGIMNKGKVLLERSLTDLQENIVKLQAVWKPGETPVLPREMEVLHTSNVGRVYTYIIRGTAQAVTERVAQFHPLMVEALPLSLEEIFIYELGGEQYAVKEILL
ncbi:MAG: ABC transporter ATP-binding protein [Oscillibacter sp.]|nr:ABC transporter ATP-binding protein [Oscillibacter sp.]